MKILIVDDQVLFRGGLVSLLKSQSDFTVVGEAGTVNEAIVAARELLPELILMDFGLPDGTGLDATKAILAFNPDTRIVFLTVLDEDERLFAAIRAGASGYLLKNVRVETLLSFLRGVERGEPAISPNMTGRIIEEFARSRPGMGGPEGAADLTARELEVLRELTTGASNSEIAARLVISTNTVKNHVRNILAKLGLRNRREAMRFGRSSEL
jgi:DNA-binding NarL/FixJ family response regulator